MGCTIAAERHLLPCLPFHFTTALVELCKLIFVYKILQIRPKHCIKLNSLREISMTVREIYKDYFKHLEEQHPVIYERFKEDYGNYL